ncbi:hypothetical protein [Mycobacterium bohemicum]|nr:hypothetical protein [Mycobacterium bohemicum]MCV6970030.1 hypothetical protein [Mycobacterium bohemicum]
MADRADAVMLWFAVWVIVGDPAWWATELPSPRTKKVSAPSTKSPIGAAPPAKNPR